MALNICGRKVPRVDLALVPMPKTTKSYMPIRHDVFADMVQDSLKDNGYLFGEEAHVLNKDGSQYFGMAELFTKIATVDYRLLCGWRSSYNKSLAAKFVVGSSVFVCDNLAFSGEIMIGRKHTVNIMRDLPTLLNIAARKVTPLKKLQDERYKHYKDFYMQTNDGGIQFLHYEDYTDNFIVESINQDIVPSSKAKQFITECYNPTHKEFLNKGERTMWTTFNAATECLKGTSINALPSRTQALHKMADLYTGFTTTLAA
jgi:hypothetical protein